MPWPVMRAGTALALAAAVFALPFVFDQCMVRCDAQHAAMHAADPVCHHPGAASIAATSSCGLTHIDRASVAEPRGEAPRRAVAGAWFAPTATPPLKFEVLPRLAFFSGGGFHRLTPPDPVFSPLRI